MSAKAYHRGPSYGLPPSDASQVPGAFQYPHIQDLQSRVEVELTVSCFTSLDTLLAKAKQTIQQVHTDVNYRRPDRAYVEWLKTREILKCITQHRDYPYMKREHKEILDVVVRDHEAQGPMCAEIRSSIQDSNAKTGIIPNTVPPNLVGGSSRPASTTKSEDARRELQRPSSQPSQARYTSQAPITSSHQRSGSTNGPPSTNNDPLLARFSQLRVAPKLPYPTDDGGPSMQNPSKNVNGQFPPISHTISAPTSNGVQPSGPRGMPNGPPPHPPKILMDTQLPSSLPRAPSPTYSPARNIPAPSSIVPPRSTARSIVGTGGRQSQSSNGAYQFPPLPNGTSSSNPYGASRPNEVERRRLPELPHSTSITAEDLFDRLRSYSILLIDVRPRDQYEEGHIHAKSIACIEPLSIRYGDSFEMLLESLVYSPDAELQQLEQMSEYDLVVYYDQGTRSDRFLQGSPKNDAARPLRYLYDILTEFNDVLPLKRRPVVLLGGIDAWTDLVGYPALKSSDGTGLLRSQRLPKQARRGPHRVSISGGNTSREIKMRRLRVYDPLNADEYQEWQEKARKEKVEPKDISEYEVIPENGESISDEGPSRLYSGYEDFFRRYPPAQQVAQSMVGPGPAAMPSRPPPLPTIPSRPAPAVSRPSYGGVSDRDASQMSPGSRHPQSAQPPLYTSRFSYQYLKLPRTGLINFGVTCYMNATIQCLLATVKLSRFFLDDNWRNFVQKNWKGSDGILPEVFSNLIRGLWQNDQAALRPISLRKLCARLNPEWGRERQQDAKEFFDFLVDCLNEDFNVNWQNSALQPLSQEQELTREKMPINQVSKIEWDRHTHRERSLISELFAGQHASCLRCTTCKNTSTTYEPFYSISVEIPRSGTATINECLRSFCQEEMLEAGEEWKCPFCKCQREATKRISITRLPTILVIHFKRFSASKTESTRKVHTPIDFPLHGLNMGPYMADTRVQSSEPPNPAITPPFYYDAYGVMRHIGSTGHGGHYVSLVRDAGRGVWRKFDDSVVTDFDPTRLRTSDRLQNEEAYIVFYERQMAR